MVFDQTPSLPDARPHSDRFRCGGRESEFLADRPPHSPTPVPILTVSGAADAKANSLQTDKGKQRPIVYGALLITFCSRSKSAVTVS